MRLFFAAFPDEESCRHLAAAVPVFDARARPTVHPPAKYHMTLVFVGKVPNSAIPALREIGEVQRVERISLRFGGWEYWDGAHAVVASSPERPEALLRLRANLAADLTRRGIAFDDKALRPHITVARKFAQAPVLPKLSQFSCTFPSFSLVSSETAPDGSIYTVVDSWPLLDGAKRS